MPDPEALVSTAEAARALGISARTLNRLAAQGQLTPAGVIGGAQRRHYRWHLPDLRRQFRERKLGQ